MSHETPQTMIDPGSNIAWAASRYGGREALVDGKRRFSFRDVHLRSNRIANALIAHGLTAGDRVAKLMGNCAEVVEIGFAAAKAGGASLNLHARNSADEHIHMLNDSGAAFLFADAEHGEQAEELRSECPELRHIIGVGWKEKSVHSYDDWLSESRAHDTGVTAALSDIYHLHYTSGTTGRAKAVINTHRTHAAWLEKFFLNIDYRLGVQDAMIHAGPLTHASFNYTESIFLRGARSIVLPAFEPDLFLDAVKNEGGTLTYLVPTMILMLLDSPLIKEADLPGLHSINYGAAPISENNLGRAIEVFGPIFRQIYGLTEARQPVSILQPWEHILDGPPEVVARLASAGKPAAGVELSLLDSQDRPAGRGEIGEICLRGDYAMTGYWNDPEATADAIRDGWVHTGDRGRVDEEGYLFLVDRKNDMIISGGFNVYPAEVERILGQHPAVRESVVFGVPDDRWGEAVAALVVLRPKASAADEELMEFVAERIARYKRPQRVEFVDSLPKNARGKTDRRMIRERYWTGRDRKVI